MILSSVDLLGILSHGNDPKIVARHYMIRYVIWSRPNQAVKQRRACFQTTTMCMLRRSVQSIAVATRLKIG